MTNPTLLTNEKITFALRSLYDRYGYSQYKMNKFEEYDLYARNKDFLVSDSVITFTDTTGKLMALKPDVTLSIVKNTKDEPGIRKLYYNENVYRVSKGTHAFKEINQVGLEAIGEIDKYCIYEVLKLAAESLVCTGQNCILEISNLNLLVTARACAGIDYEHQAAFMHCVAEKNLHELEKLCQTLGISDKKIQLLKQLASLYGTVAETSGYIKDIFTAFGEPDAPDFFLEVLSALDAGKYGSLIRVDFSSVDNLTYYNGFVFKGYAAGIPFPILSGGEYDSLMRVMQRRSNAIGFAVYMDILEQYTYEAAEFDVDTVLLYDGSCSIAEIEAKAKELTAAGESILLQHQLPPGLRCRRVITMTKGGAE